jgi:hypothetical protein
MRRISSLSLPILVVAVAALCAGCGGPRTYTLAGTQRDPGVEARVQVENIEGGNHLVTLTVRFLTPPERLGDGNTVFMVWIRQQNGTTALASQLGYTPDSREGRATATTPHQRFTLLVTAERDATVGAPSDFVILQQDVEL